MVYFSTLFISVFITLALIPVLKDLAVRTNVIDVPNERKVHQIPIPKTGGIAMALGMLLPLVLWTIKDPFVLSLLAGCAIIVFSGFLDDIFELGYKPKFAGQVAAALIVVFIGEIRIASLGMLLPEQVILPDWIATPLTVFVIVGVTNAINLSDGLDGLAGGISLLGFLCVGFLAYQAGSTSIVMFAVAMSGALFGFLVFNTHPATVFMGDAGSQLLGFLAISLSLSLTQTSNVLSTLLPILLLGFPILDTMTVMLERISRGVSPFKADKNHFHHKLMRLGFIHKEAVLIIYIVQSLLVISALMLRFYSEWAILALYAVFAGTVITGFHAAEKTGWQIKRYPVIDRLIFDRLHILREKNTIIKVSFRTVETCLPLLLIANCLIASDIPAYVSAICSLCSALIVFVWYFRNSWLKKILRICLYLSIPFITYLAQHSTGPWSAALPSHVINLAFPALFFFAILTVRYTRRQKGFRSTPMDFLILFIALVLPNLSGGLYLTHQMGLFTVKILIFFFGFEILIGELRGKLNRLGFFTVAAMLIVTVKGFS